MIRNVGRSNIGNFHSEK